jgi:hypothetical protein
MNWDRSRYMSAAICLHGHTAAESIEWSPERVGQFCTECGERIITACPACDAAIRGHYNIPGVISLSGYSPPSFCHSCGQPFPWTTRRLEAANELLSELSLSDIDRELVQKSLVEVTRDTSHTPVAASRLKRIVGRATDAGGKALWKMAIDVATDAAKKAMLGE